MTVRALILADTHIRAGAGRQLPAAVLAAAERADVIVHAGDIVGAPVLETLAGLAPTHAVLGNNDHDLVGHLPSVLRLAVGSLPVAVIHDSGPSAGRANRLARLFPDAGLVVFGHSHSPCDEPGANGQRLLNPGSSTERRRAPTHTYGWLEVDDDGRFRTALVHLDDEPPRR